MARSRRHTNCVSSLHEIRAVFFCFLIPFFISACGGSGGSDDGELAVDGTVQKGLFEILNVESFPVDETNGELGEATDVQVDGQLFTVDIPNNELTLFEATGQFTSEVTGRPVFADEPLKLIILPGTEDKTANINIATTLIAELVLRDLRAGGVTDVAALIQQHTDFINEVLGFPPGTDPTQLDFNNIDATSDLQDANLQLLLIGSGILQSLDGPKLFADGFQAILDGILAAGSVQEATAVLAILEGVSADVTYDLARQYSGIDLPELLLGDRQFVWVCDLDNLCSWLEVFEPGISVTGTSVYESQGKARVFVRTSQVETGHMEVILEVKPDTATLGEDVIGVRRTVIIPGGVASVFVDIDLIIDAIDEPVERFTVSIEQGPFAHPIFRNMSTIALNNGVKPTLDTPASRDAQGLQVNIDVIEVCNPAFNMDADDCVALDGSEDPLGMVFGRASVARTDVDVVGDCTALGKCSVNWIVDFFLVAKNNGVSMGESPLGSLIVPPNRVRLSSEDPRPVDALVRLTDTSSMALANDAFVNSWDLELEARIGSENTAAATQSIPPLVGVPGSVLVGDMQFDIGLVHEIMPGSDAPGCSAAEYGINAEYLQPGTDIVVGVGILCVDFNVDASGEGEAILVEGQLDIYGTSAISIGYSEFQLPDGLYAEVEQEVSDRTYPAGSFPNLMLSPTSGSVTFTNYLHSEGWPFLFEVDRITLTPNGVELGYSNMRYVQDVGYSSQDPRSLGILYSNDIYYRGVDGQSGSLTLSGTGVTGDFTVTGGPFQADNTAFPRARVEWQDFPQSIIDNELQNATINIDEYRLGQSTSCAGPDCVAGRKDYYFVAGTGVALDSKGFAIGDVSNTGANETPRWGSRANGDYAWSRPDDLVNQSRLKLAVPGYIISEEIVSDVLLGHLDDPVAAGDVQVFALGSDEERDGNYHPTGLSVGPEIYRDSSGIPVQGDGQGMTGTDLHLDNGVDDPFDLASAPAVKYVMRNSGITGAFNVSTASLAATQPQFYGYPMDIERFAVRTVDNVLDTKTWIDGRLALNGDAGGTDGLDIFFTNLEIDCGAKLGSINLMYEACDGQDNNGNSIDDENCSPKLHAWNSKTDIFAAGFVGNESGNSCAVAAQEFGLQHQMYFEALDKPVAFNTTWNSLGFLTDQESGQLPVYRFDQSEEGDGFPLKTDGAVASQVMLGSADVGGDRYGWLELKNSTLGVPFWNALDTDVRIANADRPGGPVAEPSVVLDVGELNKADLPAAQRNKDLLKAGNEKSGNDGEREIKAAYEWGRTGFGFKLPVYYQPWQLDRGRSDEDALGRQSRFLGRPLTKDLFVLDANAGINFIEPDRTKLSFGASADFTRLEGIEFQIDITDPGSPAAVDSMLKDLRIINGPVFEPALTDIFNTLDTVNRFANRGLEEVMREALEQAIEEIGEATAPLTPNNQDPFVTASEVLTQFQSLPQQLIAIIEQDIEGPIYAAINDLKGPLRQSLIEMKSAIQNLNNVTSPAERAAAIQVIKEKEEQVRSVVDQIERELRKVDIQITANLTFGLELLGHALAGLNEATAAMQNIDLVIDEATAVVDTACSDGLLVDADGSGFMISAAQRIAAIRQVADVIRGSGIWLGAAESLAQTDEAKQRIGTAIRRIQDATEEVLEFVDRADRAVSDVVCQPGEIQAVADQAKLFTARVTSELSGTQEVLEDIYSGLLKVRTAKDTFAERIYGPISAIKTALEPVSDPSTTGTGDSLNRMVSCILYNASHTTKCALLPESAPIPDAIPPYGINALANTGPDERDLADALFYVLENEVANLFIDVKRELVQATAGIMPGAYMSPEQLRQTLVTEIMRSTPVRTLREEMDKHFGEVADAVNDIALQIVDQINLVVEEVLSTVTGPINDALREATAAVRGMPLQSAGINGFATIAGNELERAHISAGWTMRGGEDGDSTGFKAALDAESWSVKHSNPDINTPTACALGTEESLLDVKISAYGLPINVLAADIDIEKLYLGFTLKNGNPGGPALIPIGIFGGINTIGSIGFTDAVVFDPAFAAGLGEKQTYIGASAGAVFSDLTADVAFLVGRVCPGNTVLTDLDPDVEKFLPNLPASGFTGAYLRGGATIPIIPGGCALNVGVVADFGTWIFVGRPTTIGGLVGGGATGRVACIAALKGKVTVGGSVTTDGDLKLTGEGWGVAGVGFDCDPGTWTSVRRSRDDDWCGTGDAQFEATFDNGKWGVKPPKPSAIH